MQNIDAIKEFGVSVGDKVSLLKMSDDRKLTKRMKGIVAEIHPKLWWIRIFYPDYGYSECFHPVCAREACLKKI